MNRNIGRTIIEAGFIVFLFYANLLMGEFERSGAGQRRGLLWALADIFTASNFVIAAVAAVTGYFLFEFLLKRFCALLQRCSARLREMTGAACRIEF
jgi:hypothetical protein